MDNPWANAWDPDESNSKKSSTLTSSIPTGSSFSTPTENETDIALPSWSSGPAVSWNEPSDDTPPLWGSDPKPETFSPKSSAGWSSFDNMSVHFGGSNADEDTETEEVEESEEENQADEEQEPEEDQEQEQEHDETHAPQLLQVEQTSEIVDPWTPSQSTFPPSTSIHSVLVRSTSIPGTPDAFEFGTFESGASDLPAVVSSTGEDAWIPPSIGGLPAAESEWGAAWGGDTEINEEGDEKEEEALDEWERARREKEKMDRVVPPELLASILRTFEEISSELVPQTDKGPLDSKPDNVSSSQEHPKTSSDHEQSEGGAEGKGEDMVEEDAAESGKAESEDVDDAPEQPEVETTSSERSEVATTSEEVLNHWKGGMDAVEGLSVLCETITPPLPPLSSLPSLSFQSNSQLQSSAVSKRSSEAIRLTRSTLLSSSGPLGMYNKTKGSTEWEVAVKARPEKTSEEEREESVPIGWRIVPKEEETTKVEAPEMKRKGSSILSSFFSRRSATPPVEVKDAKEASPRPSFTSPRASVDVTATDVAKAESPSNVVPPTSLSTPASPSASSPSSSYANGGSVDLFPDASTPAAPSAVSRFLNRFSRTRPNHLRKNSNSSLALSTDDLEFLEDIIPSAIDSPEPDRNELAGLQTMIDSAPLPAPLLPPPRASVQTPRSSTDGSDASRQPNKNLISLNLTTSSQILTPSPAPALPQIQTTSLAPTPPSFTSPLSRSSSPGLDMLTVAAGSLKASIQSTVSGISGVSRPSSLSNSRTATSTMKRPIPVAIMSSSSMSSSNSTSDPFSFLPPPPSIHQSTSSGKATPSLLIDDTPSVSAEANSPSLFDDFDDEFTDFHSGTPDPSQPPISASHLYSLSSAQPLFSAGSGAFSGPSTSSALPISSAGYRGPDFSDELNISISSARSVNSTNTMLLNDEKDLFDDFSNSLESPAPRATLRTPSPPALPAKSPGKAPPRNAPAAGTGSSVEVGSSKPVGSKTTGGSGLGGRVAPGRLNLPPVSASAYSRNWGFGGQGPSSIIPSANSASSAAPIAHSSSEPALATPSSSSPGSPKVHTRKVSKEAHQRTRSLVEEGIAKSGVWPSPAPTAAPSAGYGSGPSSGYGAYGFGTAPPLTPLPPILSPPPESMFESKHKGDLLGGGVIDDDDVPLASLAQGPVFGSAAPNSTMGSTFANQQVMARTGIPSSLSSMVPAASTTRNGTLPPVPLPGPAKPPQQGSGMLMDFDSFGNFGVSTKSADVIKPSTAPPVTLASSYTSPPSTKTTGALSAQDLSFFEGL